MVIFDDKTEAVINEAVDRADKSTARAIDTLEQKFERYKQKYNLEIDKKIEKAILDAVGFYSEATKDEFAAMRESHDMIMTKLDNMVTRDEFNELADDVRVIRLAVTETNKDVGKLDLRVTKLENA